MRPQNILMAIFFFGSFLLKATRRLRRFWAKICSEVGPPPSPYQMGKGAEKNRKKMKKSDLDCQPVFKVIPDHICKIRIPTPLARGDAD
jgi:hypothetical protein